MCFGQFAGNSEDIELQKKEETNMTSDAAL